MKAKSLLSYILLSVLVPTFCGCAGSPQAGLLQNTASSAPTFDYRRTTLDNGLQVITLEDFSSPIVAVQVWYEVGAKNEQPDRQGYAHMFEHMMFYGTDRVGSDEHFNFIRKVGGMSNAYTSFDQTVYLETLPSRELELALWLEAERMAYLKIDQTNVDTERKVVEEELRMGENQPYGNVFKKIFAEVFADQPYQWTPIGNIAHLRATSVPDLRSFWNRYYVPNNAVLVMVGAVRHDEARQLAEQYFGWINPGPEPPHITVEKSRPSSARTIIIDDENAPAGQVMMVWPTVPAGHPDETTLDCLSEILGGGDSSRVYRHLVADSQIAVDAGSWGYNLQQAGLFTIHATLPPTSEHYETVLSALSEQLKEIQTNGVRPEELEKARNQLLKRIVTDSLTVDSKARLLGAAAVVMGDLSRVNTLMDDIRGVTQKDIQRVANKWLQKDHVFRFIIQKNEQGMLNARKDDDAAPITAEPELVSPPPGRKGQTRPPSFTATAPFAGIGSSVFDLPFKEDRLPNGLTVMTVSNHEVPFVSVMLGLPNGAWTERLPGTAAMTLAMLKRGTQTHTEAELAQMLELYAIDLAGTADKDTAAVTMNCLSEHLQRGMELMAEVVLEPAFDLQEFAKLKTQEISGLQIQQQDPDYLAGTQFNKVVFGDHPYSRPVKGTPQQLQQLQANDLSLWWSKFARPDQATLIFAGDITPKRAAELAQTYLGGWNTNLVEVGIVLPDIPEPQPTHITLVDRPGSVQAQLRVGHLGITRRQQPEYFYSLIAGSYFGGSFNSWLNDALRVQRGLTYGAHGWFFPLTMAGTFEIMTFTRNETVPETIQVILDEVNRLRTVPPTEEEFNDTRSYLTGSFARNRETPQQIARDLWMIESQRLSHDYLSQLFDAIENADSEDCVEVTQKIVNPDKLEIVVVGDAAVLKDPLKAIAPVSVVSPLQ